MLQQPYMITAIEGMASKDPSCDAHVATAKFLRACSNIFEDGILSHAKINSMQSKPIKNMETGYHFFEQWKNDLSSSDPGTLILAIIIDPVRVSIINCRAP